MKKRDLIPMLKYILDIDWMTTQEFCKALSVPCPVYTGEVKSSADQFLQVDAIKQKMFVDYAKFLNLDLEEDMFVGENAIFTDFVKCSQKEATLRAIVKSFDNFGDSEFSITILKMSGAEYGQKDQMAYCSTYHLKKVNDLVNLGLEYQK